jgi:eukaryotic-like serine/threonine-protein kinase
MAAPLAQPEPARRTTRDLSGTCAGRFLIRCKLGVGGMGEVYRAEDTKLKRTVALKRIAPHLPSNQRYRERFLREAEYACRLNEPHIASIYDAFEDGDEMFLVMEYVEGVTLRRRLDQPLKMDEFFSIAAQCVDALVAAHQAKILHGDVKPENIMLTPAGQVKILDFGIAHRIAGREDETTLETLESGGFAGTLPYVSPEVLEEKESDARADIYSLGVVFYEALAGRNPFRADGFLPTCERILHVDAPPLRESNPAVPAELERIVGKMLAKDPAQRYSSAADLAVDLEALRRVSLFPRIDPRQRPEVPPRLRSRPLVIAALGALVFAVIAATFAYRHLRAPVLNQHASVLLADLENLTGEKLFDDTVTEAIRQSLTQSRYVRLVPRSEVLEAARRTGRGNFSRLDAALGREICRRENYRALLTGRIEPSGGKYLLTVQIVDPGDGAPVLTQTATLGSTAGLYATVDGLSKGLRKRMGESLAQISQSSEPLARVTTSSLEALQRYSRAMEFYAAADFENFLPLAKNAVELDPDFAMAHLYLARAYEWRGDENNAERNMAQARQNLDRVTERERYLILAYGYEFQGLYEKAAEQYRLLTEVYPDDLEGYRGLAETSVWAGRPEEGLAAGKHAVELDPNSASDHSRLILYLDRSNRFSEALSDFRATQARQIRSPRLHWGAGLAHLGQGDIQAARQEFDLLRKEGDPNENNLAHLCDATESLRAGLVLSEKLHSETWIPVQRYLLAQVLLARGKVAEARAEVQRLTAASTDPLSEHDLRRSGLMAVQVGDFNAARQRLKRLGELSAQRDSGYTRSCYHNLKGAVDLAAGDVASSIESQQRAALFFPSYEIPSALGNAFAAGKKWDSAAEAYQRYLEFKGEIFDDDSPSAWVLAHLTLARVLAKAGKRKQALHFYDEFLRLWAHADPDLRDLQEARVEREQLVAMIGAGKGQVESVPGNR